MNIVEPLKIATDALRRHRGRAGLTILGVVIGLASVIALVSFMQGLNLYVAGLFGEMGAQTFTVSKVGLTTDLDAYLEAMKRKDLTKEDAAALAASPAVRYVASSETGLYAVKRNRYRASDVWVVGTTADAGLMGDTDLDVGRYIADADVARRRSVCVLLSLIHI